MSIYKPQPARFTVREDAGGIVVDCRYWKVRHERRAGGGITSIVFKYGSGKNILSAPCETRIGTFHNPKYRCYTAGRTNVPVRLSHGRKGDVVYIESESPLVSEDGSRLAAVCRHRYEYHPWGYIRQHVTIECTGSIPDVWELVIARLAVAPHLNEFAVRPAPDMDPNANLLGNVSRWFELRGGQVSSDMIAFRTRIMPLHFTFLRRGVEGFDWFIADDLDQWHRQVFGKPKRNHFLVRYAPELSGYEVRIGVLEYHPFGMKLQGTYQFDFFMGLPFVRKYVPPLVCSIGGLLNHRPDGSGTDFPSKATLVNYRKHNIKLARIHNDSPSPDGVFWRAGAYPPYPSRRMKEMDLCIAECHRQGIRVTPYFSLCEFHPGVPSFSEKAEEWQRVVDDTGRMIHNYSHSGGEFGAQMCMSSGWLEFRKKTIDKTLRNHDFDGIYYDWCAPMPCLHPGHRDGVAHWSVEEFIRLLEWTRERVGPAGEMYLHLTDVPFVVAENMATRVLVFESPPTALTPDIFTPDVPYLKTCPHGVCAVGKETARSPRRFALCCLLNHVTPDVHSPEALKIFRAISRINFTRYTHFHDHHNPAVTVSTPYVFSSIYWNDSEALVLLVNLTEKERRFRWHLRPEYLGWGRCAEVVTYSAPAILPPLGFRYLLVRRKGENSTKKRQNLPSKREKEA